MDYKFGVVFAEESTVWLLILHAVLGMAVVATTTHLALWMRGFWSGRFRRLPAIRRFARIAFAMYAISFLLGNVLYPSYKVGVRAQYLDDGSAVAREWESDRRARSELIERYRETRERIEGAPTGPLPVLETPEEPPDVAHRAAVVARWFDVKEHWVALGFIMCLATLVLVHRWDPHRDGPILARPILALALAAALSSWAAALIGLWTSTTRPL